MLYSPLLSIFRLLPLTLWVILCLFAQFVLSTISRKYFFIFYKILFKGIVKIFGIKVKLDGNIEDKKTLFISNHISYLDIFILGSQIDAVFVAKSEIDNWPIINKICRLGKTIFIERDNVLKIKDQMKLISKEIMSGFNIIIFPEGTSSDGSRVLPFKSSLFGLINTNLKEELKIQPISIFYEKLDGIPVEKKFRPFFAWFGNMDLLPHAWQFLGLGISEVKLKLHKTVKPTQFKNRKDLAKYCHKTISDQISIYSQSMDVNSKIKLYEFKLL